MRKIRKGITVRFRVPDDFHVHVRRYELLKKMVKYIAKYFRRAIIMPNTTPPIRAEDVRPYRKEIMAAVPKGRKFTPLMTIKLLESTLPHDIEVAKKAGAIAGKLYMRGTTTNSDDGVQDVHTMWHVFRRMEKVGMLLLIHGEKPSAFCMDREHAFLATVREIAEAFPKLKIVLEHITTAAAVQMVAESGKNVAATITIHHLMLTLDDVVGDKCHPHNFCKPIAKRPEDREALLKAAMGLIPSARGRFFFGSDSAPHKKEFKECADGCAGVFNPGCVSIPLLVALFEKHKALNRLQNFMSVYGARFYGLPLNKGTITLRKKDWVVPKQYDEVVPFCAGQTLAWQIVE